MCSAYLWIYTLYVHRAVGPFTNTPTQPQEPSTYLSLWHDTITHEILAQHQDIKQRIARQITSSPFLSMSRTSLGVFQHHSLATAHYNPFQHWQNTAHPPHHNTTQHTADATQSSWTVCIFLMIFQFCPSQLCTPDTTPLSHISSLTAKPATAPGRAWGR